MEDIDDLHYAHLAVQIVSVQDIPIGRRIGMDGKLNEGPPCAAVKVVFQGIELCTKAMPASVSPSWTKDEGLMQFPYVKGSKDENQSLHFSILDMFNETHPHFIGSGMVSPNHLRSSSDGMDTEVQIEDMNRRRIIDPMGRRCRVIFKIFIWPLHTSMVRILALKAHDCFGERGRRLAPDSIKIRNLKIGTVLGNDTDMTGGPMKGLNDDPVWSQTMSLKVSHKHGKPNAWVADMTIQCKESQQIVAVARINLSTATTFGKETLGWFRLFKPTQKGAEIVQKSAMSNRDLWRVNTPKLGLYIRWGFKEAKLFDRDTREEAERQAEVQLQRGMDLGTQTLLPKLKEGEQLALSTLYRKTVTEKGRSYRRAAEDDNNLDEQQRQQQQFGESYHESFMATDTGGPGGPGGPGGGQQLEESLEGGMIGMVLEEEEEENGETVGAWIAEDHEQSVIQAKPSDAVTVTGTEQTGGTGWISSWFSSLLPGPSTAGALDPVACLRDPEVAESEAPVSVVMEEVVEAQEELEPAAAIEDEVVEALYDSVWVAGAADKDGQHKFEP